MRYQNLLFLMLLLFVTNKANAQVLERKGILDLVINYPQSGQSFSTVRSVQPGGNAAAAGLQSGDTILSVNGIRLTNDIQYRNYLRSLGPGKNATLVLRKGGMVKTLSLLTNNRIPEQYPGIEVIYDQVKTPKGYSVRTILTKPATSGKLPVIVFMQSLSCNSIEINADSNRRGGDTRVLAALIEHSGFMVARTEKPGMGDSEGNDCADCSFTDEVAAHEATIRYLKKRNDVDTNRIYFFGSSMGAAIAPLLAHQHKAAGLIVTGGFIKNWYEHMLEFERRRLLLSGNAPGDANKTVADFALFYTEYLLKQQTPESVLKKYPALKKIWYDEPTRQYGRPATFYMQVQATNFVKAWEKINVPTLILYGEYDWIMSEEDQHIINEILNKKKPGLATLKIIPRMSHDMFIHPSMQDSFNDVNRKFDHAVPSMIMDWLKKQ